MAWSWQAFEHVGHASVRVEGASAWSVWLRVDYWPTALGRHPRLRCGVLYHVANRTLSFHGVGRDAVQFLVPLKESWTFSSLPQLPSIRTSGSSVPPLDDPALRVPTTGDVPATPRSVPAPVSAPNPEVAALRGLVHRLVDLCDSNQREIRSLREEFSQLRSLMISRFPAQLPSPAAPSGAPHMVPPPLPPGASPPVPPPPIAHEVPRPDRPSVNHCRRSGCSSPVPLSCPVGFCQTHCTSSRCSVHSTPTRRRRCRARECSSLVPRSCVSGFASLIAPALDAHYIGGVSVSAPLWIVQQMQTQDVWLVLVVRIALTPSAVQSVEVRSRLLECVGSHLVLRGFTRSAALVVAPSTAPVPVVLSMGTQTGWGREPGEHRTRDPFACSARGDSGCKMRRRTMVFQCCLGFSSLRTSVFVASKRQMQVISPHSLWINRTHMMDLVGPEDGRQRSLSGKVLSRRQFREFRTQSR